MHISCNLNDLKIDKVAAKNKKTKKIEIALWEQKNNESDQGLELPICYVLRCAHHSDELASTHAVALAYIIKFKSNNET